MVVAPKRVGSYELESQSRDMYAGVNGGRLHGSLLCYCLSQCRTTQEEDVVRARSLVLRRGTRTEQVAEKGRNSTSPLYNINFNKNFFE